MTLDAPNPASAAAQTGSGRLHKRLASEAPVLLPPPLQRQDKKRGVPRHDGAVLQFRPRHRPPTTPRMIEVRLTAIAGLYPYGGVTRSFQLTDPDLEWLIEAAERLEARR
jgi:hypothetical protein